MKLNEIIELNGEEYTLELNRQSFLQIDKICNVKKLMATLTTKAYDYIDEIDDDYDPFKEEIDEESQNKLIEEQDKELVNFIERSLFVWLYPNYKFPISKVKEMLKPYFNGEKEEGIVYLFDKVADCIQKCTEIKADSKN